MATIPADCADLLDTKCDNPVHNPTIAISGVDTYSFHQPGDERVVRVVDAVHTTQMGS